MKLRLESDYSYYLKLVGFPRQEMTQLQVYKACIIDATNGIRNQEEDHLTPLQKQLLDARRLMNTNQIDAANRLIRKINTDTADHATANTTEAKLLYGDLSFITGLLLTIKGDFKSATQKMNQAAIIYEHANDVRRVLKSLINEQICSTHHSLSSYETGVLNVFKKIKFTK
ncbi:MAG: hypothetical protein ACXVCP_15460 [Bdellovibrio sp.]